MNYQRRMSRPRNRHGLIRLYGITSKSQAAAHIGRSVVLRFNEKTTVKGKIVGVHGCGGTLRVRFRRGLASEALAKEVKVF